MSSKILNKISFIFAELSSAKCRQRLVATSLNFPLRRGCLRTKIINNNLLLVLLVISHSQSEKLLSNRRKTYYFGV